MAKATKPMTQGELIEILAAKHELPKAKVNELLKSIAERAYADAKIGFFIPGIGKISTVKRKARNGRNPSTGEAIKIPARTVVIIKPSITAKNAILNPAKKVAVGKKAVAKKTVAKKKAAKKK